MRQNYLFPTALAIIFTLKPTIWHWTKIAKIFFVKNGKILQNLATVPRIRRLSCLLIDENLLISGQQSSKGSTRISEHFF
jgi:hypothetical protein